MSSVGVVIVTYHSRSVIDACLRTALPRAERVVVVDNHSSDGTTAQVEKWSGVTLIANGQNRGFAAACNQGIAALDTPFVLLLNPDAELMTDLTPLVRACKQPGAGAASGQLIGPDGVFQHGFAFRRLPTPGSLITEILGLNRVWPGNPWNRRLRCLDADPAQPQTVEQPAGAFLLLRRDAWERLGGFDETFYPLWFEDVDFCRRLKDQGYTIWYTPDAVARHQGAHSARQLSEERRPIYWYGSLLKYAGKHFTSTSRSAVAGVVMMLAAVRLAVAVVSGRWRGAGHGYAAVMRLGWEAVRDSKARTKPGTSLAI